MALVAMPSGDYTPYWWEFSPLPSPRPNHATRIRFRIHDPRTGRPVTRFDQVHEKTLHFFVVGNDLEFFQHVHPTLEPDGWFEQTIRVPRAGAYRLIADFLPTGGAPQLLQRAIATRGFTGLVLPAVAPQESLSPVHVNGLTIALETTKPVAGREQLVTVSVRDGAGAPVHDLEPYLGASGHLLVLSADLETAFHSHPIAELSDQLGPQIVFQVLFPRAGAYRLWVQVQRRGAVATAAFTVRAQPRDQVLSK